MEELWKDIKGYEGIYKISNKGIVSSKYKSCKAGRYISNEYRSLKYKKGRPYLSVSLYKQGKIKVWLVHRLVATCFIENKENKPCVNHIDGNKLNNKVSNLEWCTYGENEKHSYKLGLKTRIGEQNSQAKLTEKNVKKIRMLSCEKTSDELAVEFNVSRACINDVISYRRWKHLS